MNVDLFYHNPKTSHWIRHLFAHTLRFPSGLVPTKIDLNKKNPDFLTTSPHGWVCIFSGTGVLFWVVSISNIITVILLWVISIKNNNISSTIFLIINFTEFCLFSLNSKG